jgi:hypothetical protein
MPKAFGGTIGGRSGHPEAAFAAEGSAGIPIRVPSIMDGDAIPRAKDRPSELQVTIAVFITREFDLPPPQAGMKIRPNWSWVFSVNDSVLR